jgi:hypothetical protein
MGCFPFARRTTSYTRTPFWARVRYLILVLPLLVAFFFAASHHQVHCSSSSLRPLPDPLLTPPPRNLNRTAFLNATLHDFPIRLVINSKQYLVELETATFLSLVEPPPLTVILPVSSRTTDKVEYTLRQILKTYQDVDVVLVCPPASLTVFRHALRAFVDRGFWQDDRLQLTLHAQEGGVVQESIRAAGAARGAAVLVLGEQLLQDVSLTDLALLDVPFPLGVRGFARGRCVPRSASPTAADYLVPPLYLPPSLLARGLDADVTTWQALGTWTARIRDDGAGGVILASSDLKEQRWCGPAPSVHAHTLGTDIDEQLSPHFFGQDVLQQSNSSSPDTSGREGRFVIIFALQQDIEDFSSVACRLLASGYSVEILMLDAAEADTKEEDLASTFKAEHCSFPYSVYSLIEDIASRLARLESVVDVVVTTEDIGRMFSDREASAVLVTIPRMDLPYCDWMGSLSLQEWQSAASGVLCIRLSSDVPGR